MAAPNDFFSGVIGKVTFVNKWPLLLKATQDDDIPTPGYLFKEIADITYESGSNCQCLVDFLVERLEKRSCNIKYKVLKIMLHLVEQGHPAFCEGLRRKAQGVQSSAKCSGPPDPLHGMAPYVAVRKAAKALSERLFDTEGTPSRPSSNQAWKQGHTTHGTMQSREGTTKKMEGFGNTPVASQKRVTIESFGESVKDGLQQIASKLSGENKSAMTFHQADTGYKPLHGYDPTSIHSPPSPMRQGLMGSHSAQWSPQRSVPTDYSPVMMDDDDDREETRRETRSRALRASSSSSRRLPRQRIDAINSEGSSMSGVSKEEDTSLIDTSSVSRGRQSNGSKSSDQLSGAGSDLSERLASVSVADWSEEVLTVESFISSHHEGRPTPSKEELQKFVKKSSLLNCEKMIELLTSHLSSTNSYQLRCLFGIEGILKEDLISSDVALGLLSSHLTSMQDNQDKAVRAKALKILRQLERLEADTSLDQPLMPESQLISQSVLADAEAEILGSSASTTPVKTALPSDLGPTSDGAPQASRGSLFSGMTVATRSTVPPGEKTLTGISSLSENRNKAVDEGHHPVANLLMDTQLMPSSNLSETTFLLSDAPPCSATNQKTQVESTRGIYPTSVHNVSYENPEAIPVHQKFVDSEADSEVTRQPSMDPIMSREAGFADLWKTVSPKKEASDPKSSNQVLSELSTASAQVNMPSQQHPRMTSQPPVMTAQHISQMYPQLSSTMLSGTTSTPINLAKKPTTGFGFVVDNGDDKQKAGASRDAFSFIQDAMKSSKS